MEYSPDMFSYLLSQRRLQSGHAVAELSKEDEENQKKYFKGYAAVLVKFQPGDWFFPHPFALHGDRYFNFEVRETDVFVMTYPKCGTSWMQEIIWTLRNNGNLDNPKAKMDLDFRVPFIEFDSIAESTDLPPITESGDLLEFAETQCPGKKIDQTNIFISLAESEPDPRTLKTHLPFSLAPKDLLKTAKVVYVIRNAKDVCLSYLHHHRLLKFHDYEGTQEDFVDFFVRDELMYSPFWTHIKEAWDRKDDPNLHICFFEQLKKEPVKEISRLNQFLETNLTEEQIEKVAAYTNFANMKARNAETSQFNTSIYVNKDIFSKEGGLFWKVLTLLLAATTSPKK